LREVAGDKALYFDPLSSESMADAMHVLLSDATLRNRMKRDAPEHAALYSWDSAAEETMAVFRAAAGK
jgi:glycosyltransferase involved in cell wall biosynthesis